jgi:hypothetical protein
VLGDVQVDDLTADQIQAWHRGMVVTGKDARASQSSANRVLQMFEGGFEPRLQTPQGRL